MDAAVLALFSVVAVLHAVAGLVLLGLTARGVLRARKAASWSTVTGTVLLSRVVSRTADDEGAPRHFHAELRYRYELDGAVHESSRVTFFDAGATDERPAAEFVARFPAGASVTVHYDPARPDQAVLDPASPRRAGFGFLVGGALLAMAASMWVGVRWLAEQ